MNKELLKELQALAKKYGFEVLNQCVYCGREKHADAEDNHYMVMVMVTLSKKWKDE